MHNHNPPLHPNPKSPLRPHKTQSSPSIPSTLSTCTATITLKTQTQKKTKTKKFQFSLSLLYIQVSRQPSLSLFLSPNKTKLFFTLSHTHSLRASLSKNSLFLSLKPFLSLSLLFHLSLCVCMYMVRFSYWDELHSRSDYTLRSVN